MARMYAPRDVRDEEEYEALVELTWLRYPLVQGRGNFGSIDDDPPADAEYTEARLAPLAHELPRFPNLLVNGAPGIPPHNLREVAAGRVLGPDYPTGGVIPDPASLRAIYETGAGAFRLRARATIEGHAIVVTELPYGVAKGGEEGVIREIVELVNERELTGIDDVQDRSDRDGMCLWIGLNPETDAEALLADLYARDVLEVTIEADLTALVDGVPKRLTLPELLAGDDVQRVADRFGDARRTTLGDGRA